MITLETIVESIKLQLKPRITEDVIIHDGWLIQMVNESRAALVRALYVSGDNFIPFFQDFTGASVVDESGFTKLILPSRLLEGLGRRNILYLNDSQNMKNPQYHYCSYEELVNYSLHRFGGNQKAFTEMSDHILLSGPTGTINGKFIFEAPNDITGYDYKVTPYPIGANNVRQLELITFDHILPKLGMPVDSINDGIDSTRGVGLGQQAQVDAQGKQIEAQQEAFDKNMKLQAQQLFDQRELAKEQVEANQKQIDAQRVQLDMQKQQFDKQERLQAQQLFDQSQSMSQQIDSQHQQLEAQKSQLDSQKEAYDKTIRLQAQQLFDQNQSIAEQIDSQRQQLEAQREQMELQKNQFDKQQQLQAQQVFDQREAMYDQLNAQKEANDLNDRKQ